MKTTVLFQWLPAFYPRQLSNCPMRKTLAGRQNPDFFHTNCSTGKKETTKKPTSVIDHFCLSLWKEPFASLSLIAFTWNTWKALYIANLSIRKFWTPSSPALHKCADASSQYLKSQMSVQDSESFLQKSPFSLHVYQLAAVRRHQSGSPSSAPLSLQRPHLTHLPSLSPGQFHFPSRQLVECMCMQTDKNSPSPCSKPMKHK